MASTAVDSSSPPPSFGWLSPRISFSFDLPDPPSSSSASSAADPDFEFHPSSLPLLPSADELIADGVLLPLKIPPPPPPPPPPLPPPPTPSAAAPPLPSELSPKAPRCSARLREFLLRRKPSNDDPKPSNDDPKPSAASKPLRRLLFRRSPPPDPDPSSVPLLSDLPRHSLDSKKPSRAPRVRIGRAALHHRGSSVDSPRIDPSGRIVFGGLERCSSSPGSFNGGPNPKARPIQRSYSANVRVAPVLNLFGFNPLFAASKREAAAPCRRRKPGGD